MKLRIVQVFLIALIAVAGLGAQSVQEVLIRRIEVSRFPKTRLLVSVKDVSSVPVSGLTLQDFRLAEDGQEVPIDSVLSLEVLEAPLAFVLAIDVSGTMAREDRLENAKKVAIAFLHRLDGNSQAALITFGTEVKLIQDFTQNTADIERAIQLLQPEKSGFTRLYDAISQAQKLARSLGCERRFIVILTDGKDEGSFLKEDDIIVSSQKSDLPVYTMGFGSKSEIAEQILGRIATLTGGSYQYATTFSELNELCTRLTDDLNKEYVVDYESSLWGDGEWHDITLKFVRGNLNLTADRRFQTPIQTTFWSTRRIVLLSAAIMVIVAVLLILVFRKRMRGVQEPSIAPITHAGQQARGREVSNRVLQGADNTILMKPSVVEEDAERTRIIGSSPRLRSWLVVMDGSMKGDEFMFESMPAIIGRSPSADVRIQDDTVSGQHAKVFLQGDTVFINDLASTNGTFVNGAKVVRSELRDNDRVRFGDIETVFKCTRLK
jgi:VWFA-related protein